MSSRLTDPKISAPDGPILQYGGQAVIEGVMMRGPRFFAVACRKPDGDIVLEREEVDKSIVGKFKWLNKPFLRGTLALIDAMALGSRALAFASNVQMQAQQAHAVALKAENAPPTLDRLEEEAIASAVSIVNGVPVVVPDQKSATQKINDIAIGGTIVFSICFGLALFVALPTVLTGVLQRFGLAGHITAHRSSWLNVSDGLIRMVIFFGYIALISLMKNIREVFMYHGAEHKAINTLEAGLPLTVENALKSSRIHPRCGTSFIFIVLVINLIVFTVLPRPDFVLTRLLLHIAVITNVAGIAYEIIKFAGKFRGNPLVMAVLAPGMWSQYLTTREPNAGQIEVALAALTSVLEAEGHLAAPTPAETEPITA